MDLNYAGSFMMGFGLATVLYFIISGLAWIESAHGMGREDSQALVDLTDGKTLAEVNEIMQEGHKRIEERAFVAKQRLGAESTSIPIAAEIERFSHELVKYSLIAEPGGVENVHIN